MMKDYVFHEKAGEEKPSQNLGWLAKEVLSFKEALVFLDISSSSLYKLTHKKTINYYKPNGKLIYFKKADLIEWMLSNKQQSFSEQEKGMSNYLNSDENGRD